jgi:energy-coupling factor transporter ATP-binding protein EcfA2
MLTISSLTLTHVAGVEYARVEVPQDGVLVVHGPNERGKSTVLRAFRLLLSDTPTGSTRKQVRELKDIAADEPTTVSADLRVGPYALTVTKAFNKGGGRCELSVSRPRVENLTGREAADRFAEILSEEVDADLLAALTVEQGKSMDMVEAAGLGPLEHALGSAPETDNGAGAPGTSESSLATGPLLDRIAAERERYYTPTGRPARELKDVADRLDAATTEQTDAASRYSQAQGLIADLERLRAEKDEVARQEPVARADAKKASSDLEAGREAHATLERHRTAVLQATQVLELAEQRHQVRVEKVRELTEATDAVAAAARRVSEAADAATEEKEREAQVRLCWEQARRTVSLATAYADYLAAVKARHDADDAREKIAEQQEQVAEFAERIRVEETSLAENPVDDRALAAVHQATADLRRATSVRDAAATTMSIRSISGGRGASVTVDGEDRVLSDDGLSIAATSRHTLGLGDFEVTVTPALDLRDVEDDVDRARSTVEKTLERFGVDSAEAAERRGEERRKSADAIAELKLDLSTASGGLSVTELDERAEQLTAAQQESEAAIVAARERVLDIDPESTVTEETLPGIDAVRGGEPETADLPDAAEVRQTAEQAGADAEDLRDELDSIARAGAVFQLTTAEAEEERQEAHRQRLETALAQAREQGGDESLEDAVTQAQDTVGTARQAHDHAVTELAETMGWDAGLVSGSSEGADSVGSVGSVGSAEPAPSADLVDLDTLEGLAAGAQARVDRLRERAETISLDMSRASGALGEHSGVAERLEEATARLERLEHEHNRVQQRAAAADGLFQTVEAARDEARRRYEAPFRASFEKLARTLYGRPVTFEFNDDLTVARRVMDGRALETSQLSGGAQEQIAVLGRLAVADIIGGGEGVPIFIDDALGFSDAGRAQRMNLVLAQLASEHQIIVLTCDPGRFDSVPGATMVSMDTLRGAGRAESHATV